MPKISVDEAAMLYSVTNKTVRRWIQEDNIKPDGYLYDLDALQKAYDRRRALKHMKRFAWFDSMVYYVFRVDFVCLAKAQRKRAYLWS